MEHAWYSNAVIYSLDVETFYDSNGDGIGDFRGLIGKLDYIAGLGVNAIWLLPFYPSDHRDNGYDVTDYYSVDSRLGTLGDFAELLDKAESLGLRIIIDLVVNHTSIKHPWFQQARRDPESPYRDFYVWSDKPQPFKKEYLLFQGAEESIWTFDKAAGQYYLHHFFREQPDLNISNPKVQEEILKIMGFWLRLGVHGLRIDAARWLVDSYGTRGVAKGGLLPFLNKMREAVRSHKKDGLLLAEVNGTPKEMMTYLQDGHRMHMLFNFFANQHLFLSLATKDKRPLEKAIKALPPLPEGTQWLHFLRHHDELNLKQLKPQEQQAVFKTFAPEKDMQVFGWGIRRRLAPMMGGNEAQLRLAYSLLFSLPGVPLIRYGDEVGMGDDLSLKERTSVRTPMQWSATKNAGFSTAPPGKLIHPVISKGLFGYQRVNVLSAQQHADTLLNWVERLISIRRQCPQIGYGKVFVVPYRNKKVIIHGYEWKEGKLLFIHNLSGEPCMISGKDAGLDPGSVFTVFGKGIESDGAKNIALEPFAFHWLRTKH